MFGTILIVDVKLTLFALIFRMAGYNDKFIAKKQLGNEGSNQRYGSLSIEQKEKIRKKQLQDFKRRKAVGKFVGPPFQPTRGKFAGSFAPSTLIAIFLIVVSLLYQAHSSAFMAKNYNFLQFLSYFVMHYN